MSRTDSSTIDHARIAEVISRVVGSFVARGQLRSDEADDVRSTVTLRVLRQFEEGIGDLRSVDDYVARMAINAATDVLRGRRLDPVPLDDVAPADPAPAADDRFATRQMLHLLWSEIRALPLLQRRALLLHVRDDRDVSAIHLLVFTGVATLDEIALALEYSRAEIESMWDRVPMPDLAIAELLGTTRAHVISFRRAARERLERARRRLLRWIAK
jgi:DNA-directed RNA polymerase specialized sigma24 family protein